MEVASQFLRVYRSAFSPLERQSPARQALTDQEFLEAMGDRSVLKFVGWSRDRVTCAMAIMATDLSVVPWISVPFFEDRFPEHYERGAVYYFHALLVRPEHQGGPWARLLLEELTKKLGADRAVAAFDCSDQTLAATRLPDVIAKVAGRLVHLVRVDLGRQHYYAYSSNGFR